MIPQKRVLGPILGVLSQVILVACETPGADKGAEVVDPEALDGDGDGYTPAEGDCDDTQADVHPEAYEECNGVDNNCVDGLDDEGCDRCECGPIHGHLSVGEYSDDWDCLNRYVLEAQELSSELLCEHCDMGFRIYAELWDGVVESVPECEWDSLESWDEGVEFYSIWGMVYEPEAYPYPLVYYYPYGEGSGWVPISPFYITPTGYYHDYLSWVGFDEVDPTGVREVGLFTLFVYPF